MLISFPCEPRFYYCKWCYFLPLCSINSDRKECCVRGTLHKDHAIRITKIVKERMWLPVRKQFPYSHFFPLFSLHFYTVRSLSMISGTCVHTKLQI